MSQPSDNNTTPKAPSGRPASNAGTRNPGSNRRPRQNQNGRTNTRNNSSRPNSQKPAAAQNGSGQPRQNGGKTAAAQGSSTKTAAQNSGNNNRRRAPQNRRGNNNKGRGNQNTPAVRIVPLGGLLEVGKNCTAIECENDIIVLDCGLSFPDGEMLGVDIVIPDFTYLIENKSRIRGIVITHGHEDHIGGLPYLLKQLDLPIYATKLTIGLIEGKFEEHRLSKKKLHVVNAGDTVTLGKTKVEFIRVNHSIPDACGLAFHTPGGLLVHTGDFKIDYDPIDGKVIDLPRFAELGKQGILCLMEDSTNAENPGMTASEHSVGSSLELLFQRAKGKRIVIASFASNIHRIQQICDCAKKHRRKVVISGRSMENVTTRAIELGYLKVSKSQILTLAEASGQAPERTVVITTGSQGEPMSALSRMANGTHRQLSVSPNDFIIISARPIPGNEKHVGNVVNALLKLGAEVIYESMYDVHVSGHARQEELKTMMALCKPKYLFPVHGEYRHLVKHAGLAESMGISRRNIIMAENGQVVEISPKGVKKDEMVTAGRVMVDGLGVGDVGNVVLRDRKRLAEEGILTIVITIDETTGEVLAGPDIVSRGFVYVRESEQLLKEVRKLASQTLDKSLVAQKQRDWAELKLNIREAISGFLFQKIKRSPMILPIIMEV